MTFPECLNVSTSNAEMQVFIELQHRGLTKHMRTQHPFTFNAEEEMVHGTAADFFWYHPHPIAVFIDGPHHDKVKQGKKDEAINLALKKRGIRVERFSYRVPLRKRRRREICDSIQKVLKR